MDKEQTKGDLYSLQEKSIVYLKNHIILCTMSKASTHSPNYVTRQQDIARAGGGCARIKDVTSIETKDIVDGITFFSLTDIMEFSCAPTLSFVSWLMGFFFCNKQMLKICLNFWVRGFA